MGQLYARAARGACTGRISDAQTQSFFGCGGVGVECLARETHFAFLRFSEAILSNLGGQVCGSVTL